LCPLFEGAFAGRAGFGCAANLFAAFGAFMLTGQHLSPHQKADAWNDRPTRKEGAECQGKTDEADHESKDVMIAGKFFAGC